MHSNQGYEPINPTRWSLKNGAAQQDVVEQTRRHWRKIWKRNGGRKAKTLRSHRTGR